MDTHGRVRCSEIGVDRESYRDLGAVSLGENGKYATQRRGPVGDSSVLSA